MGRFADLCGEVAAEADETPDGLVLPEDALARLYAMGWEDGDIADALEFVHASFIQNELLEAADSLSACMVGVLGEFGHEVAFRAAATGRARLALETIGQLTRRVAHLEEILRPLREGSPVDRSDFDQLRVRLAGQDDPLEQPARRAERAPARTTRPRRAARRPKPKR